VSVGQHHWYASTKRRPFLSVYPDCQMLGEYVGAYTPEQREYRENKIFRGVGLKPAYRINIRFDKRPARARALAREMALHEETLAQARAEGRIE
jgi:hypothetical protein